MNDAAKFLDAHPPVFSIDELTAIASDTFGITGTIRPLWGERDQNVMIERDGADDVVLKITNSREDPATVDLHTATLRHIAETDPGLPVARLVPAKSGETVVEVKSQTGDWHLAYLCTRLPGITYDSASIGTESAKALRAVGRLAGRSAQALRGFYHSAAGKPLFWDVRQMAHLVDSAPGITDEALRQQVLELTRTIPPSLLPKLLSLRTQAIHHDVNKANVLVDPNDPTRPTGLIDFGDMIHGTIAQDVAVCAMEMCFSSSDVTADATAVVAGYDSAVELEEAEIDLIWDLMVARCVSGLLIGGARHLNGISSPDNVDYESQYAPIIDSLLKTGRGKMTTVLRHACRFPPAFSPASSDASATGDRGENDVVDGDLLDRRHAVLGRHALITYDRPVHTVRGDGVWLFDASGNRYLDAYNNVPHVGHCHPHVVRALSRQSRALNTNTRYIFESVIEYGERLATLMPGDLGVTLFVNSGSEANDVAQRMALKLTGNSGSLIVDGAYHGVTSEIYALSPSNDWGGDNDMYAKHPANTRDDIGILPVPDLLRSADPEKTLKEHEASCHQVIQQMTETGNKPALFMFCSAFSSSGILDLPRDYIRGIAEQVQSNGGMIICDEVQYGFGRSGDEFWGYQNYGVTADVVTLGKPMANGLATGAMVTTPDNVERFTRDSEFFSTFGGNPVACAAANAVLDVIEQQNLQQNAREVGNYMRDALKAAAAAVPGGCDIVADVRGRGLFVGVEIVKDGETLSPDGSTCSRIKNHLRNNFVLVGTDGFHGNVLKIRPPMVAKREHADILAAAFGEAIEDALRSR